MAVLDQKKLAQPYTSEPSEFQDALFPVRTTAALADIANNINTEDKYVGRMVWNSDTGLPVWADAATAAGTWSNATGAVAHTPA
jgi:hypothetical protein